MLERLANARLDGRSLRWAVVVALIAVPAFAQLPLPTLPISLPPPLGGATSTPVPTGTGAAGETPTPGPSSTPGTATPGTATPGTATPGTATPGTATPGTATPGSAGGGGTATLTSAANSFGTAGQTVDAGSFEVANSSGAGETITEVDIDVSNTEVVSSFTLTGIANGSSSAVTVSGPQQSNSFVLPQGLFVPAGQTATFSLVATIASSGGATTATAVPTVTGTPPTATPTPLFAPTFTPVPTPTQFGMGDSGRPRIVLASVVPEPRGTNPWRSLAILQLVAVLFGAAIGARAEGRRLAGWALIGLAVAGLFWMQTFAGCGGEQTSTQTVTAVTGTTNGNGTVTFGGVPLTLGTVSRPTVFTFNTTLPATAPTEVPTPIPTQPF